MPELHILRSVKIKQYCVDFLASFFMVLALSCMQNVDLMSVLCSRNALLTLTTWSDLEKIAVSRLLVSSHSQDTIHQQAQCTMCNYPSPNCEICCVLLEKARCN